MVAFQSAGKALACASAIQKALAVRNRGVGVEQLPDDATNSDETVAVAQPLQASAFGQSSAETIRVRIGLNAGEPIAEDDPDGRSDLFGTAVIVAARIAAQAHGGEILVSDVVRQLVAGKGFLFNDRGEHALKGFEDPVRVWAVRTRRDGAAHPVREDERRRKHRLLCRRLRPAAGAPVVVPVEPPPGGVAHP